MKRILSILLSLALVFTLFAGCAKKDADTKTTAAPETTAVVKTPAIKVLRCSTTTSVNDSGLMSYLEPLFEAETGYDLQITSNGTGAAIKLGESGDADVLLVHAKASEDEFVAAGFGLKCLPGRNRIPPVLKEARLPQMRLKKLLKIKANSSPAATKVAPIRQNSKYGKPQILPRPAIPTNGTLVQARAWATV